MPRCNCKEELKKMCPDGWHNSKRVYETRTVRNNCIHYPLNNLYTPGLETYKPFKSYIFPGCMVYPLYRRINNYKINMNNILSQPLATRCETIVHLVNECTNKELENFFPVLIDDLFGISTHVSWNIRSVRYSSNCYEYDILRKFLQSSGPVFRLCYKLLSDCHLKYDFPLAFLPKNIQEMIANGMMPSFYADKLQVDHKTRTPLGLALNPFELYMFHFTYHLVNPNVRFASDFNSTSPNDFLYMWLVDDYLSTFLPCNGASLQPLGGLFSLQSSPRSHSVYSPTRVMKSPTLLLQSVVNQTTPVQHNSLHNSVQGVSTLELMRSEVVAQLFIDFWLSTKSYDPQNGPLWSQQYLPTGEHVRVVRILVKHLHYFANSLIEDSTAMAELKRVIMPACQNKFYKFLRYTMQHWPLDTSFRLILETWLSYIQPWRYQDISRKFRDSEERFTEVEAHWLPFIAKNLLAYSLIFQQLLTRFSRIDLATPKNALMLFRVTKVFSLPNLNHYLVNVEHALEENKPGVPSKWSGIVRHHIVELEGCGYQYQFMFGPETVAKVEQFLKLIQQALVTAQQRLNNECENQKGGVMSWIFAPNVTSEYSIDERKKVITNLSSALNSIKSIYQLHSLESQYFPTNSPCTFETPVKQDLTPSKPKGVPDIKYEGDPDLQPIRSFENAFLVRLLYDVSTWINNTYANEIQEFYGRNDWVGGISRQILSSPLVIHTYGRSCPEGYSPRLKSTLPARLSLRGWAHHRTLVLIICGYLLVNFLGYPVPAVIITLTLIWVLFLFFVYLIGWAPNATQNMALINSSF